MFNEMWAAILINNAESIYGIIFDGINCSISDTGFNYIPCKRLVVISSIIICIEN